MGLSLNLDTGGGSIGSWRCERDSGVESHDECGIDRERRERLSMAEERDKFNTYQYTIRGFREI